MPTAEAAGLVRLAETPLYAVDGIVRRAEPLQKTADAMRAAAHVHETVAVAHDVKEGRPVIVRQGGQQATLDLIVDNRIAPGCVWIPAGTAGSIGLAANGSPIEITQG